MSSLSVSSVNPSTRSRYVLSASIAAFGFKVMPYSRYKKQGIACKIIKGKAKYSLCTSLGRLCDVTSVPLNSRPFSLSLFLLFLLAYFFLVSRIIKES